MTKFAVSVILMLLIFLLIPPLFSEGMIFDISYSYKNDCGKKIVEHGLYFDNVFSTLLDLFLAYLGIVIPFIFTNIKVVWRRLCTLVGCWYFAGLIFEIINFRFPSIILNSPGTSEFYTRALICALVGIIFIITSETWSKQKN